MIGEKAQENARGAEMQLPPTVQPGANFYFKSLSLVKGCIS